MKEYSCAVVTKTGRRRNNQDNYLLRDEYAPLDHGHSTATASGKTSQPLLAAVCDGMGGEAFGEKASFLACREIGKVQERLSGDFEANQKLIRDAILKANSEVCDCMLREQQGRMGSTVISVLLQGDEMFYTNLGDSRIYLLRGGKLTLLTKDHTEGQSMVDAGVLTQEQLKTHPSRNKLNRHIGIFPDELQLECAVYDNLKLKDGDKILLCSDGVYGVLSEEEIISILSKKEEAAARAEQLVDASYNNGGKDNMTAMVIDISVDLKPFIRVLAVTCAVLAVALVALVIVAFSLFANSDETSDGEDQPVQTEIVYEINTDDAWLSLRDL